MNPNIAANQQRLFLEFLGALRPHLRRDSSLPRRIKELLAHRRAIGSRDRKLYRELLYTAVRFLPWVDGARHRGDGQAAGLAPTAGSEAGGVRSAGALAAGDEQALLDTDPVLAAKIIAWLAPDLKPTAHYRAALCADWPAVPDTLAEKAAVLTQLVPGRANPPDEPSSAAPARRDDSPYRFSSDALSSTRPEAGFHLPTNNSPPITNNFSPAALLPAWFHSHCPAAFQPPHLDAINRRANIWVRLQCNDRNLALDEFRARGWSFTLDADLPDAICLPPNAEVAATDAYRRGFVEIQDLGSQLVLAHAVPASGGRWLDACAGAGGKTLQLARLLGSDGHVDATDIRLEILDELRDRAQRARLTNIAIVKEPGNDYDGVLVDAPCSGSGTWRRQPHLKWAVQPGSIAAFAATQLGILTASAPRVRSGGDKGGDLGGLLVYATCSLSHQENRDVVAAFLKNHPHFAPVAPAKDYGGEFDGLGTTLLPGTRDTDGFYVATLRRT